MRCSKIRANLEEYANEVLAAATRQEIERHLAACGDCREALRVLRQTSVWLRSGRDIAPEPGPTFWARLRAAISERQERPAWFWFPAESFARRLAYGLTGLALLLALYSGLSDVPHPADYSAMLALDSPQTYAERYLPAAHKGTVDREQVMVTLVSEPEPQP